MKRGGFKRKVYEPAPVDPGRITRAFTHGGTTAGPRPKEPADRLAALRELARGEECTGKMYGGFCRCHPETVVWAHPNTLAERKGLGYKANDTAGAFLGVECHAFIDQPGGAATYEQRMAVFEAAQQRTRERLREIAASKTLRPWKSETARMALAMLEEHRAGRTPALPGERE